MYHENLLLMIIVKQMPKIHLIMLGSFNLLRPFYTILVNICGLLHDHKKSFHFNTKYKKYRSSAESSVGTQVMIVGIPLKKNTHKN